jgi:hypothetical protein
MSMGKKKNKIAFSEFGTSCNGLLVGLLSSHPQLFPDLDQFLNGTSTGDAIIHHATSGIRSVIGLTCSGNAQAGQITAKQLEVISAHDVVVAGGLRANIETASHDGKSIPHSLFLRLSTNGMAHAGVSQGNCFRSKSI